jgi:hypothetical protein
VVSCGECEPEWTNEKMLRSLAGESRLREPID